MGHLIVPVDETEPDEQKAGLDRRWPAAHRRYPRRRCRQLPSVRHRVHHRQRDGAALAVHPRQLDEAAAEGPDPRTAARHAGGGPAAGAAQAPITRRRLLDRLNYDDDSPLRGRIRTPTTADGTIKDNSVLKMLSMSIEDGALYQWFDGECGTGDMDSMLALLKRYWQRSRRCSPRHGMPHRAARGSCMASDS